MDHTKQQILEISSDLKKLNVLSIAQSNCTGKFATNVFMDEWKERYIDFCIGKSLKI
jgi:metal-dependent hydrolase (beta-lactamase superfamily II)